MSADETTIKSVLNICRHFVNNTSVDVSIFNRLTPDQANNWIKYAKGHKLLSLCHHVLSNQKDLVEKDFYRALTQRSKRIALRNMALAKESREIRKAFGEQGISLRSYKGVVFAQHFYKSLSLRHSIDVDFAIRFENMTGIYDIMRSLGYKEVKGSIHAKAIKKSRAYYLDYPWEKITNSGFKMFAEFHLSPAHKALHVACDFADYLNPDRNEAMDNQEDFSLTEHALFIIIHHGAVDTWGTLMHLIDLHQILTMLNEQQLSELLELCQKAGVRKFLDAGVALCERMWHTSYKVSSMFRISPSLLDQIEDDCLHSRLNGKWTENRNKLKYHLALRDTKWDQLKTVKALLRYGIYKHTGI